MMLKVPDFSDERLMEKYSSAFTLSDMEVFVFPELFFPLVIANIMSPIIWTWLDDPWFKNINTKSFNYKVNRIKQFIMEHYIFNLDLETWGLTNKNIEIERFSDFVDMNVLKQSNALFGYEGDKYYFDMDIRRHFGLDKYTTDIIPYWKTETVEAMTAFKLKPGFTTGAGECVSLSALYAAALFIVGKIPLENIYLIATPLHSQNFIDIDEGVITNNRRILTKNMWYNGSSISEKGRRALEKEKVTIVSHISGYIHQIYKKATINPLIYTNFTAKLKLFLKSGLSWHIFINYIRSNSQFQNYFQLRHLLNGKIYFIEMEKIFELEHKLQRSFSEQNSKTLLTEIPVDEYSTLEIKERIILQDVENIFKKNNAINNQEFQIKIKELATRQNCHDLIMFDNCIENLFKFISIEPKTPSTNKQFISCEILNININQSREEIISHINENARLNEVAQLALYTYRDMDNIDWRPFIKAAIERNPVSLSGLKGNSIIEAYKIIKQLDNFSIYDSNRLAMPDEVWNFQQGDGVEKAILLANYIYGIEKNRDINLVIDKNKVCLEHNDKQYLFTSSKKLQKELNLYKVYQEVYCKFC